MARLKAKFPYNNPNPERLGFRVVELGKSIGLSRTSIWRMIKRGDIKTARFGPTTIIPITELVRLGLLE